jgi:hypothetical protein
MTTDQPETTPEHLTPQTGQAGDTGLSPAGTAVTAESEEEALTSLLALGSAADAQMTAMEQTMTEFQEIFYGNDLTHSARLLRRNLTAEQRAELARLITEP